MDFIACCYGTTYTPGEFDPALLEQQTATPAPAPVPEVDLAALMAENEALRAELTARREAQQPSYTPKPLDLSEYETRKLYIDAMLTDAGWTEGKDWLNEVELPGMPNKSEVGYADYVLYDDAHRPLAVIEAKRTCVDPSKGRQQAQEYAAMPKHGKRRLIAPARVFNAPHGYVSLQRLYPRRAEKQVIQRVDDEPCGEQVGAEQ